MQDKFLRELKKGDIIYMRVPFEENTPDYYNGYSPQEIRGGLYTDRDGQASKARFIVVVGHGADSVQYLPLTSRRTGFDSRHQYVLQDNSMTYRKDPDMKSYVEVDSLRSVYVNPKWGLNYSGRLAENDMANIMVRLAKKGIDFESDRDQRAYVSHGGQAAFDKKLGENGYSLSKEQNGQKTYSREDGRTVTKTRWGLVKYHVPLSREEVTRLVARHEGKPVEFYKGSGIERPVDEFSRAVADITKNRMGEREVIQ